MVSAVALALASALAPEVLKAARVLVSLVGRLRWPPDSALHLPDSATVGLSLWGKQLCCAQVGAAAAHVRAPQQLQQHHRLRQLVRALARAPELPPQEGEPGAAMKCLHRRCVLLAKLEV